MLRFTAEGIALFLVPFAAYAVLLVLARRWPWLRTSLWGSHTLALALCGAGLVVVGLVALGALSGRSQGTYVPARLERGQLIPGHIE